MKADQSADCTVRSLPGNAPDCAIGVFIGLQGKKVFKTTRIAAFQKIKNCLWTYKLHQGLL
jgi:hypothetical protein